MTLSSSRSGQKASLRAQPRTCCCAQPRASAPRPRCPLGRFSETPSALFLCPRGRGPRSQHGERETNHALRCLGALCLSPAAGLGINRGFLSVFDSAFLVQQYYSEGSISKENIKKYYKASDRAFNIMSKSRADSLSPPAYLLRFSWYSLALFLLDSRTQTLIPCSGVGRAGVGCGSQVR